MNNTNTMIEDDGVNNGGIDNSNEKVFNSRIVESEEDRFDEESEEDEEVEEDDLGSDFVYSDYSDDDDEVLEARRLRREYESKIVAKDIVVEEGLQIHMKTNRPKVYARNCNHKELEFELGMKFRDCKECKDAIVLWAIENGYNIRWSKTGKTRLEAKCIADCPWKLYASKLTSEPTCVIKTYVNKHNCILSERNRQANSGWVADQLVELLKRSPNLQAREMQKELKRKFNVVVTKDMCYRAKSIALVKIRGTFKDDYKKLRSYVLELMRIDREGKFVLKTYLNKNDEPVFHRLFIGFSALKKGFLIGCRRLIGLDACFLKTMLGGALLAAVGKDCNNKMYPLAWAIVEKENEDCWSWFCENLFQELNIIDGFGWTFMSDKQKGLINAIQKLAPNAEHRHCVRHVYENWKRKFAGPKFRSLFHDCVKSNTMSQFKHKLDKLKNESEQAFDDFCSKNPKSFCKSLFSSYTKTDMTDNNISECFNSYILQARDKPIILLLEDIRMNLMARMHDIAKTLDKCTDVLCPNVRKKLYQIQDMTRFCDVSPGANLKYEIHFFKECYNVDLSARECSCRDWELTGLPCCHALACINHRRDDVVKYVDPFFLKNTCVEAYRYGLEPILGEMDWPADDQPPIMPPNYSIRPGRPRKLRKRGVDEVRKQTPYKLSRHGIKMTCQICGKTGHNKRSCTELRINEDGQARIVPSNLSTMNVTNCANATTSTNNKTTKNRRVQFVVGARATTEALSSIMTQTRVREDRVTLQSDNGGSQVDNPTPHSY